jgi:uncharacterized repeat protein (TIGR03803 family)
VLGRTYSHLYDFTGGGDEQGPYGTVAVDANGRLYGTTSHNGADGYGIIWEITPKAPLRAPAADIKE